MVFKWNRLIGRGKFHSNALEFRMIMCQCPFIHSQTVHLSGQHRVTVFPTVMFTLMVMWMDTLFTCFNPFFVFVCVYVCVLCVSSELDRAQRLEERERILREIWMNGQPDISTVTQSLNRYYWHIIKQADSQKNMRLDGKTGGYKVNK